MGVQDLIHAVVQDGALVVFFAFTLAGGWRLFDFYLEKQKIKQKAERHDTLLDLRKKTTALIDDRLKETVWKTGASRAFVVEYHNGGEGLGGMPFLKMSSVGEACNDGVESYSHIFQNIPCYQYPTLTKMIDKEPYIVLDTEAVDLTVSPEVYRVMTMQGMGKSIVTKMTNGKRTIGYVGLDYNLGNDNFNKVEPEKLQDLAIEIGAWLSVK